ncbi:MAG TPA: MarR family transcriptional regulator [Gaiella sp.]|jgi:DNA-binding MarR family transcriptional regulator|nr:MarR family transcriptional regulator [Gaiella sp.]
MSTETTLETTDAIRIAAFRAAIRSFLRTSEQLAREEGLTPRRYLLLLMIKGAPNGSEQSTVTELSERLQLAQSTVTELVGRAERAGLIQRERSEKDLRVAHLRLTPDGERRLALSVRGLEEQRHELRQRLDALDQ